MTVLFLVTFVGAAIGVCLARREAHLRRLRRQLEDERVLNEALAARLHELMTLSAVAREVTSVLSLEDVLGVILDNTLDVLGGGGGAVLLVEEHNALRTVCVRGGALADGQRVPVGPGSLPGLVAAERQPDLGARGREAAMIAVPLLDRGELIGVLYATAPEGQMFNEYDLRTLTVIADHAVIGIVNARLYDTQVERAEELLAGRPGRMQVAP